MSGKRTCAAFVAAVLLTLSGCGAQSGPTPSPEPSPVHSVPVSAPPEALTPEELLAQRPIDDTQDAFLVDTGGRLGTLLVTAEKGERDRDTEFGGYRVSLSVWDPRDMDAPIQAMDISVEDMAFGTHEVLDADLDGHMDFSVLHNMGNGAGHWYLWVWDEEAGRFLEVPEYREISFPRCDPETEVIGGWARNSGAGDGTTTFHRWEDGKLVCIRRVKLWWEPDEEILTEEETTVHPMHITVEDRVDGELSEVYARVLAPGEDYLAERAKWENLDYHGEE